MKTNTYPFPRIMPTDAMKAQANTGYAEVALTRSRNKLLAEQERQELLETAAERGIGIVHIYDTDYPKGGLTVAFKKCTEYTSGCMVEVAVNTCSIEDNFSKKLGVTGALTKFFEDETINLPLLNMYDEDMLNYAVKRAFTALYYAVV